MEYRSRRLAKHIQREKTRHGNRVYYYRQSNKCRRVRLEGEYGSEEFWKSYALAAAGIVPAGIPRRERIDPEQRAKRDAIAICVHRSLARAKHRAKKKGMAFDLTADWVHEQMKRQDFKCALTGIPFLANEEAYRVRAYAPSLDRIDNAWGYTMDNVRIVVFAINVMLSDWGEEVFHRVSDDYLRARKARS